VTEAKARGQGGKIWPDLRPPEGFRQGYSNPPRPGHTRGALGRAAPGAVQHALERGSKRITRINEGTRQGIRQRIQEAIEQGMTPAEAGQYVREWTGFDEYRAERIARTEMMFSYNDAAIGAYQEVGVQQVVADDGDEDEECAARHGQVFTLDEAEGIQDHPNGTLDWLPIDPGTTPTATQLALNQQRPIENASTKIGSTPPPRSGWVEPLAAPPSMATPPLPSGVTARQVMAAQDWEAEVAARQRAINPLGAGRGTFGPEEGAIFDRDGRMLWSSKGSTAHVDLSSTQAREHLNPGNLLTHFHPDAGDVQLSAADVKEAVNRQVTVRAFHADGNWVQFEPKPGGVWGSPHGTIDFDRDVANWKAAHPGATWGDAYNATLREWGEGTWTSGRTAVEPVLPQAPQAPQVAKMAKVPKAPKAPKPKPGELPKDLQARANARLVDAPRDFKPAKHWDEAKGRLKDHGLEMPDDFEMHVDDANDLLAAAERLKSEWPEDWDRMLRWEVGRSMGDSNAMAAYQGGFLNKSVVTLQRSKFDARGSAYYRRVVDSSRATGWYTREGYHGSTLIHEFGHVIDYTRNGGKRDLIARWVKELSPRTRTEGWVDWSHKKPGTWDIGVSGYGRTKWVENFAEAFVEAMTRPQSQWSHPTRVLWRLLHEPVV